VTQGISIYRGAAGEPMPGFCRNLLVAPGLILERRSVPAGEFPDSEFHSHVVAVERSSSRIRLSWKDNGLNRDAESGPGHVFIRSQQPMRALRISSPQICVALSIDPATMELALPEPFRRSRVELPPKGIGCDAVVNHLFAVLELELDTGGLSDSLMLECVGRSIAVYLASRHSVCRPRTAAKRQGLSRDRLSRVLEYIDAGLANGLTLDELAGVACLSTYHFGRMFKLSTGQSVHQFVLSRRIERSKMLLRNSELSLAEISAASGFCGQSQFTAVFRRAVGAPPGEWRRES